MLSFRALQEISLLLNIKTVQKPNFVIPEFFYRGSIYFRNRFPLRICGNDGLDLQNINHPYPSQEGKFVKQGWGLFFRSAVAE